MTQFIIDFETEVTLDEVKKQYVIFILERCKENKYEAARVMGITVKTLYNMLHKFGLWERFKRNGTYLPRAKKEEMSDVLPGGAQ